MSKSKSEEKRVEEQKKAGKVKKGFAVNRQGKEEPVVGATTDKN